MQLVKPRNALGSSTAESVIQSPGEYNAAAVEAYHAGKLRADSGVKCGGARPNSAEPSGEKLLTPERDKILNLTTVVIARVWRSQRCGLVSREERSQTRPRCCVCEWGSRWWKVSVRRALAGRLVVAASATTVRFLLDLFADLGGFAGVCMNAFWDDAGTLHAGILRSISCIKR